MKRLAAILGLTIFFATSLTQATIPSPSSPQTQGKIHNAPRIHNPIVPGKGMASLEKRTNRSASRGQRLALLMVLKGISGSRGNP